MAHVLRVLLVIMVGYFAWFGGVSFIYFGFVWRFSGGFCVVFGFWFVLLCFGNFAMLDLRAHYCYSCSG